MIDTPPLTQELAQSERRRLLSNLHFHRTEAKAARRALDQLEEACARVGIRLIREPLRAQGGQTDAQSPQRPG